MDGKELVQELVGHFDGVPDAQPAAARYWDPRAAPEVRDAALLEVVLAYRADRRWAPLLLQLLAPDIGKRLRRFGSRPPVTDEPDVHYQLVVEVLEAALRLPIPLQPSRLAWRIVRRAGWKVYRWLYREARYQELIEPLPEDDEDDEEEDEE